MNLSDYSYINTFDLSEDLFKDVEMILMNNNKQKIFNHEKEVADVCYEIAQKFNLDKEICQISCYLHDISAVVKPSDMLTYIQNLGEKLDFAESKYPFLLHQRVSAKIAQEYFKISNELILNAIGHHTTLSANPTNYDMALFIADKLAWDQTGKPPYYEVVISALEISLEAACLSYMHYILDNNMVLCPHSWLLKSMNYLENCVSKVEVKDEK